MHSFYSELYVAMLACYIAKCKGSFLRSLVRNDSSQDCGPELKQTHEQ